MLTGGCAEQRWTSILLALYGAALLAVSREFAHFPLLQSSISGTLTRFPTAITGYIADRIESRQWPLLAGLVALGVSTALLCVGTNMALWIAGRILQGASTAVVWTAGLALLADSMNSNELGQAMGWVAMSMTLGLMTGPLIGGVLYQHGGYYAVFGLAFGFIGLDIIFRLVMIERRHAMPWLKEEQGDEASHQGETNDPTEKPANVDVTTHSDRTTPVPAEESATDSHAPSTKPRFGRVRHLLNSSRMIISIWTYLIISVMLTSFDSVLPLFVKDRFGWAQTAQGLIFIPISVPSFLEPLVGFIVDKFPRSYRYICSGALFLSVPPLVTLRFVTHNEIGDKVLLCALLVLVGLCVCCLMPPVMVEVSCIVNQKEAKDPAIFGQGGAMALAYGLLNAAWAAGSIIGPFFAGFIRDDAGWSTMTWALSILTGVTGVPVLLLLGGHFWRRGVKNPDDNQA